MSTVEARKGFWEIVGALSPVLVPAAIALAGHFIGQAIKEAEIASQERRADLDRSLARESVRVSQANLINTLMKSLTSSNSQERQLAVQAVLIALPDEGPVLARTIAQTDKDRGVQDAANASIDDRIKLLLHDLFGPEQGTRKSAARQLVLGWRNDPKAAAALVSYAMENPEKENGLFNAFVVLSEFAPSGLVPNREKILALIEVAKMKAGPATLARASALQSQLGP